MALATIVIAHSMATQALAGIRRVSSGRFDRNIRTALGMILNHVIAWNKIANNDKIFNPITQGFCTNPVIHRPGSADQFRAIHKIYSSMATHRQKTDVSSRIMYLR